MHCRLARIVGKFIPLSTMLQLGTKRRKLCPCRLFRTTDAASSFRLFTRFEKLCGLLPYSIRIPPSASSSSEETKLWQRRRQPIIYLSPVGFALTCFHLVLFLASSLVVLYFNKDTITLFTDTSVLAEAQTTVLDFLHCINTFVIFICVFVRRNRDQLIAIVVQRNDAHFRAMGVDMKRFYVVAGWAALWSNLIVLAQLIGLFVHGMYFWSNVLAEQLVFIYGFAMVMPTVYIQLMLMQCVISLLHIRVRFRVLNALLMKVFEHEVDESQRIRCRRKGRC